jgi:phosphatidylinositol-3-phosphatase
LEGSVRRVLVCLAACVAVLVSTATTATAAPPIKHVFVITLENKGYDETFGPASAAPYLSHTLTSQGQLLTQYYGIGHASLDNYIAMVSGQAPNVVTQADCPFYFNFVPGIAAPADGQVIGQGCVYPSQVKTVANQLESAGLTWKGYMEDMGTTCRHPALNSADSTQTARVGDQYAARHNPFVYFHSVIDTPSCAQNDVPLDRLDADLQAASSTPSYAFITPNLCHDGHDQPCVNGEPGGLASADAFLQTWVPKIMGSPAWAEGSLLVITFDEAGSSDTTACCGEKPGYNTPNPGGLTPGPGGGRTGTVLISQFIQPGTTNATPYNHYSLLKSTEDVFGLSYLGYAGQAGLAAFGSDVYNAP